MGKKERKGDRRQARSDGNEAFVLNLFLKDIMKMEKAKGTKEEEEEINPYIVLHVKNAWEAMQSSYQKGNDYKCLQPILLAWLHIFKKVLCCSLEKSLEDYESFSHDDGIDLIDKSRKRFDSLLPWITVLLSADDAKMEILPNEANETIDKFTSAEDGETYRKLYKKYIKLHHEKCNSDEKQHEKEKKLKKEKCKSDEKLWMLECKQLVLSIHSIMKRCSKLMDTLETADEEEGADAKGKDGKPEEGDVTPCGTKKKTVDEEEGVDAKDWNWKPKEGDMEQNQTKQEKWVDCLIRWTGVSKNDAVRDTASWKMICKRHCFAHPIPGHTKEVIEMSKKGAVSESDKREFTKERRDNLLHLLQWLYDCMQILKKDNDNKKRKSKKSNRNKDRKKRKIMEKE
mmetsp:Transcript_673/g.1325  ORF Transcript_673/g.1325 Transcript_673/m.1325 type:complete len:399 (-) Transcript_673:274-1470(-)|eukprot:CAMPEP_0113891100 /NCGR_PEP_ID=MMETSP0780_2-20120614/14552_1 /TAXON_ID=652834 /ORGANISM="Palpitomonas bilix" /LENGTH=398 /DNA_ID=CAMNT_0000880647 /DNA_START=162 /DNA_END=1358 /DNA_ORIENTATION=- /assembly_acc=CAM_ASM_000599